MDPATIMAIIALIVSISASIMAMIFRPVPVPPMPADLSDFQVPTASAARPIPVVYGTVMVKGPNVTWYGDLTASPIFYSGGKK